MNRVFCQRRFLFALLLLVPCTPSRADPLTDARVAYEAGRKEEAVKLMRQAAEKGDPKAQYSLGVMCEHGRGVAQDYAQALDWYLKAANQGHAQAQNNLGYLYYTGRGAKQDYAKAFAWYSKSVQNPDSEGGHKGFAWSNLGNMYFRGRGTTKDLRKAADCYLKAAQAGNSYAENNLGYLYERGLGVARDEGQAALWYRKAAEQGFEFAQHNLGLMYETGRGLMRSQDQAHNWYDKAAHQGNRFAQYRLGRLCELGLGVSRDLVEAYKWYLLSSRQGDRRATQSLRRLEFVLTPEQVEQAKARAAPAVVLISRSYDPSQVRRVAVVSFTDYPGLAGSGEMAAGAFEKYLLPAGYGLIERRQVRQVLEEQSFQVTGAIDPATIRKVGELLGVDALVFGDLTDYANVREQTVMVDMPQETSEPIFGKVETTQRAGDAVVRTSQRVVTGYSTTSTDQLVPETETVPAHVGLSARLVSVQTGEILWSASGASDGSDPSAATEQASALMMKALVKMLKKAGPPAS